MRWAMKERIPKNVWRRWYTWRPIRINRTWVWGEYVERKREYGLWWYRFPKKEMHIAESLMDSLKETA